MMNKPVKRGSYLLEVLASNTFQGQHLVISEKKQAESMGLRYDSLRSVACVPHPVVRGFRVTRVPYTRGVIPGQEDIMRRYREYPALFQLANKPIIGEVITGPFRGRRVALFNQPETRNYFCVDGVRTACREHRVWRGIAWRFADSHAQAQPVYCHEDNALLLTVFGYRFCYKSKVLSPEQHTSFYTALLTAEQQLQHWLHRGMDMVALARIYQALVNGIGHQSLFEKIRDTLQYFQDILTRGHCINTRLFLGHCKILRRIATEDV